MEVSYLSLPCSNCIKCNVCLALVRKVKINTFRSIFITSIILQHHLPNLPTLAWHFFFFIRVHLDWQTLITLFLLHMEVYLNLTLLHPRAQNKLLSSFYLFYLSTYLPRLNCLVRFYFSIFTALNWKMNEPSLNNLPLHQLWHNINKLHTITYYRKWNTSGI